MHYLYVILLTILINMPFGYLRARQKKFSLLWFLFIHLPVPFVVFFRKLFEVPLKWKILPLYFAAYFLGQWLGQKIYMYRKKQISERRL